MSKQEFLIKLCCALKGLPESDIEERIEFYSEIIDDKMEEGISEAEAVASLGNVDDIAKQILASTPIIKIVKERINKKVSLKVWEIVLLVLGAPIWLSVLVSVLSVVLSIYICLWVVIISLWSVFASLCACVLGGIASGVIFACTNQLYAGIAMWSASICIAGISIFAFFGCRAATNGLLLLTKKIALWIKKCFIKKERV